jgi:hypothetical protein
MKSMILHLIGRCIEESLETEVERMGRKRYVRRRRAAVINGQPPASNLFGYSTGEAINKMRPKDVTFSSPS